MAIAASEPDRSLGWMATDPLEIVGDGGLQDLGDSLGREVSPDERARAEELDRQESSADDDVEIAPEALRLY